MDKSARYPGAIGLPPIKGAIILYLHNVQSSIICNQYIGLQILEKLIMTRWKTLPDGQRQGEIQVFAISFINNVLM